MESMSNRRAFLRTLGAAAGLGAAPWITGALAQNSPNERINVAVMGIHSRGSDHIKIFSRIPNVQVTVLCDVDERLFPKAVADLEKSSGRKPRTETDIRRVLEDKDVDVISIAAPNHWHSLASVWACQAGKDVYVEKPASYNIFEGRKAVEAARRYNRIVQTGSQHRSSPLGRSAVDFVHSGKLGRVYMIRGVIYRSRESIGRGKVVPVPEGVHFDTWLGPAPQRPFYDNRFHYTWHWFWDTGNGETGNNGPHFTDLARWFLQKKELPRTIQSMGGFYVYDSDQETPNTQISCMEYPDGALFQLEIRGLYTNFDDTVREGMLLYGSEGWMKFDLAGGNWAVYHGREKEPAVTMNRAEAAEKFPPAGTQRADVDPHFINFIECVRSRKRESLASDILDGHLAAAMCHQCNIAYRTGRTLIFDPIKEQFIGDAEANDLVSRNYRKPFVVPEKV